MALVHCKKPQPELECSGAAAVAALQISRHCYQIRLLMKKVMSDG